ncbi:MAG: DNA polymerase IV [Candidatus Cloacimonadota bacterium]|nr:MAG: DNA polymerase IV [Candidatus Cloacimonadota bacterium]
MTSARKIESRKIIHVDMDAFFASVEIRDNPALRGKPVVVGGKPDGRGVVSTCSYEARKYGISSAMPCSLAYRLCPDAVFLRPRFEVYRSISMTVRQIFYEYTDLVEPVASDEAYLDVTENKFNIPYAVTIAGEIRKKIFEKTGLTASAGVSYNKFLAKIASDLNKPNGLTVITPDKAECFLDSLPIGKFHGIGKVTEKKMNRIGIKNGAELRRRSVKELIRHFGKAGYYYYNAVRGIDERKVIASRERKSVGKETTFLHDTDNMNVFIEFLSATADKISQKMRENNIKGKTLTVKMKYDNFEQATRSVTLDYCFNEEKIIFDCAVSVFSDSYQRKRKLRLLGLSISNLLSSEKESSAQMILPFFLNYRNK